MTSSAPASPTPPAPPEGRLLAGDLTPYRPRGLWATVAVLALGSGLLCLSLLREGAAGPWQISGLATLGAGLAALALGQRRAYRQCH